MKGILLILLLLSPTSAAAQRPPGTPADPPTRQVFDGLQHDATEATRRWQHEQLLREQDRLQQFREFERDLREERRVRQLRDAIEERDR